MSSFLANLTACNRSVLQKKATKLLTKNQGYIFWPFPPPLGEGGNLSKLKNLKEDIIKKEGKRGEKKKNKSDKHTLKHLYEA